MNTMVSTENFPSELCSKESKENFARMVLKVILFILLLTIVVNCTILSYYFIYQERANKRKLQETVREFSLLSRGLLGSEYATQLVQFGL